MKKQNGYIGPALVLVLVLFSAVLLYAFIARKAHAQINDQGNNAAFSLSAAAQTSLNDEINSVVQENPGIDVGVVTVNLKTGQTDRYGIFDPFEAASCAKLVTAVDFLHHVEVGDYTLSDNFGGLTARQQLKKMIEVSDDYAWLSFNTELGHSDLLAYANSIGFTDYNPDKNTMPASDIALLLQKLYTGKLLNKQNTTLLLSFMASANYRQYIDAVVPGDVNFYHKTGLLEGRIHDAAIIGDSQHPIVLVVFTKNANDPLNASPKQVEIIHHVASDVLAAYNIK
jgi:beta-lactamase class A